MMAGWAGIALALRAPTDDALHSRLSTYLHPLAGRILAWHALNAIAATRPAPAEIFLVSPEGFDRAVLGELPVEVVVSGERPWWLAVEPMIPDGVEHLLIVDAAAAALSDSPGRLAHGPVGRALIGEGGVTLAVWISRSMAAERMGGGEGTGAMVGGEETSAVERGEDTVAPERAAPDRDAMDRISPLARLADGLEQVVAATGEGVLVRDRAALARASMSIRDRLVDLLIEGGVTFLLPETVLVDVDVRIGSDTVIYPGVILEGQTTIGTETVIGPGCRIIDSWIGSGVELKGWNYIAGANVRNRAVLEPYVRRGFD